MTSPDFAAPGGAQGALSLAGFYQNADPEVLAQLGNLDLFAVLEQVRESVFGMLGGFGDVAEAVWDAIQALIEALTGGDTLDDVVDWVGGLGGAVADFLQGRIPLGWLTAETPNVLDNGAFDGEVSLVAGEGWSWDAGAGRTSPGAALFTASGVPGLQQSRPPFRVAEGQELAGEAWVKWSGLAVSSGAPAVQVSIRWWDGAALVAESVLGSVSGPSASSDWVRLSGLATCPAAASFATVSLAVTGVATAGSVWFDDAALRATAQSIPQRFVSGLEAMLSGLGDDIADAVTWIKDLIERLTGKAWGSLAAALGGVTTWAGQLGTILGGGVVSSPLPSLAGAVIGQLQATLNQFQDIFNGIVVTPINGIVSAVKGWFDHWFGGGSSQAIPMSMRGAAGGVAPLDSSKKVPVANLSTDTAGNVPTLDSAGKLRAAQVPDLSAQFLPVGARGAVSGVAPLNASSVVPLINLPEEVGGLGGGGFGLPYAELILAQDIPLAQNVESTLGSWTQQGTVSFTVNGTDFKFPKAGMWLLTLEANFNAGDNTVCGVTIGEETSGQTSSDGGATWLPVGSDFVPKASVAARTQFYSFVSVTGSTIVRVGDFIEDRQYGIYLTKEIHTADANFRITARRRSSGNSPIYGADNANPSKFRFVYLGAA